MNIILVDSHLHQALWPLTFTRPVAELQVGIMTLREKWQRHLPGHYSWLSPAFLSGKYPLQEADDNWLISGGLCPHAELAEAIAGLEPGESLVKEGVLLAQRQEGSVTNWLKISRQRTFSGEVRLIDRPWKIFQHNATELESDYTLLTKGRQSAPLSASNQLIGERIFLEPGARAEAATFNTTHGPVYLGADSEVMEGSVVRGGLSLGKHSQLKMGAKIYGATSIGPWSKVGGEVNNAVILGYSNKGHDGFLGNAVLGEWCNLGADTNNSNLKNNYDEIKVWDYQKGGFSPTGLQFCGLIMGDHSKSGINTMFNTGTVVGVMCNIFGSGFPRTFVPSFSWGGAGGYSEYRIDKALATARRVMERRQIALTDADQAILQHIFDLTSPWRQRHSGRAS